MGSRLDPCCGTGAYLAEVLRRIAANHEGRGLGALAGARVKQAATERVLGFEIMPAPFVVAHLQVGLTMQDVDAPLVNDGRDRAQVFLTNALTGWEPTNKEKQLVAFQEMAEERDRANHVKRDRPILVILGNPPYNGFAGIAVDEERKLSDVYRTTWRVRRGHRFQSFLSEATDPRPSKSARRQENQQGVFPAWRRFGWFRYP